MGLKSLKKWAPGCIQMKMINLHLSARNHILCHADSSLLLSDFYLNKDSILLYKRCDKISTVFSRKVVRTVSSLTASTNNK